MKSTKPPWYTILTVHLGLYLLFLFAYIRQFVKPGKMHVEKNRKGYAPLFDSKHVMYRWYIVRRLGKIYRHTRTGGSEETLSVKDRFSSDDRWTYQFTGSDTNYLNFGSCNNLGLSQTKGPIAEDVKKALKKFGLTTCTLGKYASRNELEKLLAKFVGVEDALVFGTSTLANILLIPCLITEGCFVVSDESNHASMITGLRASKATVKVFRHNDMNHLDEIIENALIVGQPNGKPWKKVFIAVEGLYGMDGTIVNLPEVVRIKRKYGAYIYIDEAHSMGVLGPRGRGASDYYGIDLSEIDILIGTFAKTFGSMGGFVMGPKSLVNFLRVNCARQNYGSFIAPIFVQQAISALKFLVSHEGTQKVKTLAENSKYFHRKLRDLGLIIYGSEDSHVVPVLVFYYSKLRAAFKYLSQHNIAVMISGYPAVPFAETRLRFGMASYHTKEQIDYVVKVFEKMVKEIGINYLRI